MNFSMSGIENDLEGKAPKRQARRKREAAGASPITSKANLPEARVIVRGVPLAERGVRGGPRGQTGRR